MSGEYILRREQTIPRPRGEVFAFFADAANLDRITPPWLHFRILTPQPMSIVPGALIDYRIRWRGLPLRWRTRIEEWHPETRFVDMQIRGPYALWHHTHVFEPAPGGTHMSDVVRYRIPFGPFGALLHRLRIRSDVEAIFDYRMRAIERIFRASESPAAQSARTMGE